MKRRIAVLALCVALGTMSAGTSAFADCNQPGLNPPTPAAVTGVAVIAGGSAVIAFGGETQACWTTDGIGHSHEWHAEGLASDLEVTATSVTITHASIPEGFVTFNRDQVTGLVAGSTAVGNVNATYAGWVNVTGVAAGVIAFAGI